MPVGFFFQRVPGDDDGARLLVGMEPQQEIGEAENGTGRSPLRRIIFGNA